jgi:uncharacterized protein
MSKIISLFFSVALIAYLAVCGFLYVNQDTLIYHPQPRAFSTPQSAFTIQNDDEEIVISTRSHSGSKAIIYFGGNADDVSQILPVFDRAFPDYAIYLMHYRGYGGSTGKPSEMANVSDAIALFKKVQKAHPDILVIGRSLGSGIATELTSQFPVSQLVLITPYNSVEELAEEKFPFLPVSYILRDKYNSGKFAKKINTPTLVLMAENDYVIPQASTEKLFNHFKKNIATLITIKGVGHESILNSDELVESVKVLLNKNPSLH